VLAVDGALRVLLLLPGPRTPLTSHRCRATAVVPRLSSSHNRATPSSRHTRVNWPRPQYCVLCIVAANCFEAVLCIVAAKVLCIVACREAACIVCVLCIVAAKRRLYCSALCIVGRRNILRPGPKSIRVAAVALWSSPPAATARKVQAACARASRCRHPPCAAPPSLHPHTPLSSHCCRATAAEPPHTQSSHRATV